MSNDAGRPSQRESCGCESHPSKACLQFQLILGFVPICEVDIIASPAQKSYRQKIIEKPASPTKKVIEPAPSGLPTSPAACLNLALESLGLRVWG